MAKHPSSSLFFMVLWWIWRARNNEVIQVVNITVETLLPMTWRDVRAFSDGNNHVEDKCNQPRLVRRSWPSTNC